MTSIDPATTDYLGGYGTPDQQRLFQEAASRIRAMHADNPDDVPAEDMEAITEDYLVGAAEYALGDTTLESFGADLAAARDYLASAMDRLSGAMIAARSEGVPIKTIATLAGVGRQTVYDRTT